MYTLLLYSNAPRRETVVREGMSVCEDRVIGSTLQSDGTKIAECITVTPFSSECSEFRQVYSSSHFIITTSHDQFSWFIIILELECTFTKSNGRQFRQVYSSFSLQSIHSQTLHENKHGMHHHQTGVISNWASLFIISFFQNHSSIPMKHARNCNYLHSLLPFQSLPKKAHSQSHTQRNYWRNNNQSSVLSISHNPSSRNDCSV